MNIDKFKLDIKSFYLSPDKYFKNKNFLIKLNNALIDINNYLITQLSITQDINSIQYLKKIKIKKYQSINYNNFFLELSNPNANNELITNIKNLIEKFILIRKKLKSNYKKSELKSTDTTLYRTASSSQLYVSPSVLSVSKAVTGLSASVIPPIVARPLTAVPRPLTTPTLLLSPTVPSAPTIPSSHSSSPSSIASSLRPPLPPPFLQPKQSVRSTIMSNNFNQRSDMTAEQKEEVTGLKGLAALAALSPALSPPPGLAQSVTPGLAQSVTPGLAQSVTPGLVQSVTPPPGPTGTLTAQVPTPLKSYLKDTDSDDEFYNDYISSDIEFGDGIKIRTEYDINKDALEEEDINNWMTHLEALTPETPAPHVESSAAQPPKVAILPPQPGLTGTSTASVSVAPAAPTALDKIIPIKLNELNILDRPTQLQLDLCNIDLQQYTNISSVIQFELYEKAIHIMAIAKNVAEYLSKFANQTDLCKNENFIYYTFIESVKYLLHLKQFISDTISKTLMIYIENHYGKQFDNIDKSIEDFQNTSNQNTLINNHIDEYIDFMVYSYYIFYNLPFILKNIYSQRDISNKNGVNFFIITILSLQITYSYNIIKFAYYVVNNICIVMNMKKNGILSLLSQSYIDLLNINISYAFELVDYAYDIFINQLYNINYAIKNYFEKILNLPNNYYENISYNTIIYIRNIIDNIIMLLTFLQINHKPSMNLYDEKIKSMKYKMNKLYKQHELLEPPLPPPAAAPVALDASVQSKQVKWAYASKDRNHIPDPNIGTLYESQRLSQRLKSEVPPFEEHKSRKKKEIGKKRGKEREWTKEEWDTWNQNLPANRIQVNDSKWIPKQLAEHAELIKTQSKVIQNKEKASSSWQSHQVQPIQEEWVHNRPQLPKVRYGQDVLEPVLARIVSLEDKVLDKVLEEILKLGIVPEFIPFIDLSKTVTLIIEIACKVEKYSKSITSTSKLEGTDNKKYESVIRIVSAKHNFINDKDTRKSVNHLYLNTNDYETINDDLNTCFTASINHTYISAMEYLKDPNNNFKPYDKYILFANKYINIVDKLYESLLYKIKIIKNNKNTIMDYMNLLINTINQLYNNIVYASYITQFAYDAMIYVSNIIINGTDKEKATHARKSLEFTQLLEEYMKESINSASIFLKTAQSVIIIFNLYQNNTTNGLIKGLISMYSTYEKLIQKNVENANAAHEIVAYMIEEA